MKVSWTAEEVLRAVRGQSLHTQDWIAGGVSIDSRTLQKGDLFVSIKGDSYDGHAYVHAAMERGAAAAIVGHQPPQVAPDAPLLFVDDTLTALQDLGRVGRCRSQAKIVAVTGSVGKTSSKEQLRLMLGAIDDTYANEGSLNNQWGVPLTLARLPASAKFGIVELGMNHTGELAALTRDVKPHLALITTIEAVHLEHFASVEAIADAKAEIFLGMDPSGIAVLNRDNAYFGRLLAAARTQGLRQILSFGQDPKSDARLLAFAPDSEGTTVEAVILDQKITFRVGTPGMHLAFNALGCLLACAALDTDLATCAEALAGYRPPVGRGTRQSVSLAGEGTFTLIDESFNASPASTHAAIAALGQTPVTGQGRRIAALGDMKELGATSSELHRDLMASLLENRIDHVFCCGEMMAHLFDTLPAAMRGGWAEDSATLAPLVTAATHAGDAVMVKGSHSMHMEIIVAALSAPSALPHQLAS
ncbi:MAG: UDP-N-acetylmuramoylalanyl-D-glutamyl-2,6-diaminopimelate--D-alanyl-D-alanine ligase [Bdellovibrionales bacterium]|jgi:UDP-N-acetylmuramoyl-tripeptide--D-alanyl-D-alanine ligase